MKKSTYIIIIVFVIAVVGTFFISESYAFQKVDEFPGWNVYFSNLKTSIINGNIFVPDKPEIEKNKIKAYDVIVSKSGDYATYQFDIINSGDFDVKIYSLVKIEPKCTSLSIPAISSDEKLVCDNLEYKIFYTDNGKELQLGDMLKANEKINITLKIGFKTPNNQNPTDDVQITLYDFSVLYNN